MGSRSVDSSQHPHPTEGTTHKHTASTEPAGAHAPAHEPSHHHLHRDGLERESTGHPGSAFDHMLARAPEGRGGGLAGAMGAHRRKQARRGTRGRGGRGNRPGHVRGRHRATPAGRSRRAQSVRNARGGQNVGGRSAKNFQDLTGKLTKMGVSKQDVASLSKKYGVPERMILGVMMQESGGNPNSRSGVGAMGLMQLMPGTARSLGVHNPYDPKQNLEGGVKYLSQMMHRYGGNEQLALAAYNAGPGRVHHSVPNIRETQNYVRIISGNMGAAQAAYNAW